MAASKKNITLYCDIKREGKMFNHVNKFKYVDVIIS